MASWGMGYTVSPQAKNFITMNQLKIQNLKKTYSNGTKALDGVSLTIENGMFGLLGPNGAGKSTLMRSIAALQKPDEGHLFLNDINIIKQANRLRQNLGYLPQEFGVYPRISAYQLLEHLAILKGIHHPKERKELINYLLDRVNLFQDRNKQVKGFSGGMKQRIGIAQCMIGHPKLIIVDEPTAGLDPAERNRFHNLLADIGQEAIVIISTHIVEDIQKLCTRMAILNQGKVAFNGTPQVAIQELEGKIWQKEINRKDLTQYQQDYHILSQRMNLGKQVIHVWSEQRPLGFQETPSNLEDVYFKKLQA